MEEKPPTRRWFRFSLRTFLVAVTLVGLVCGWVGMQLQQKRRHEAAVIEMVKLGGRIEFWHGGLPVWKRWLFESYAVEFGYLDLDKTDATDELLSQIRGMNIGILVLSSTKITDKGLTNLQVLTSLRRLFLSNTQVTDAGLTHLEGMASLVYLELDNTQVTQAGVDRLKKAIPDCEIAFSTKETTSVPTPSP